MSLLSRLQGLKISRFPTFGFNVSQSTTHDSKARSLLLTGQSERVKWFICHSRFRFSAGFSTSSCAHDKPPSAKLAAVDQNGDPGPEPSETPIVDITLVEKHLQQILEARKKYLNDADFSRIFYEKLDRTSVLPEHNLRTTYGDFVVLSEPRTETVDDFSSKLNSFNEAFGLEKVICEDEPKQDADIVEKMSSVESKSAQKVEAKAKVDSAVAAHWRHRNFDQELRCFVEACIHANLMSLARTTIIQGYFGSKRKKSGSFRFRDVSIYNVLLQAYASQGRLEPVRTLMKMMNESQVVPNLESYVILLEALGRSKSLDKNDVVDVQNQIQKLDCELHDIYHCKMTADTKHYVNKALSCLDIDISLPSNVEEYDNVLLESVSKPCHDVLDKNPYHGVVGDEIIKDNLQKQLEMEMGDFVVVKSIWDKESPEATPNGKKRLKQWIKTCRSALRLAFDRNVNFLRMKAEGGNLSLYPYMKVLSPDEYVNLMLEEIRSISSDSLNYSPTLNFLWKRLGQKVMRKYNLAKKVKTQHIEAMNTLYADYWQEYNAEDIRGRNQRMMWRDLSMKSKLTDLDILEQQWPAHVTKNVGKFLFDIILYETKLTIGQGDQMRKLPAFYTIYRSYGQKTKQELKPHPSLARLYAKADDKDLHFEVDEVPMLVPPIPWTSIHYGGNLLYRTKFIRLPESTYKQSEVLNTTPSKQLNPVFDSLNTLSSCAWIINQPILDLLLQVFRSGGNTALDIPTPPDPCAPLPEINSTMSQEDRSKAIREKSRLKRQRAEMYSLWCNELYRLSIANQYRHSTLWFPHNMDFRGRVYPTPPHFNHLGSDVVRSMLLFAKGKKLGKNGLDWLKIHLINLTGLKKRCSNQERLDFANEILDKILDSADRPMDGEKWWQESEEPWQTLASCMEVAKAVRSGNPEEYVCHYPVHQDGSFNGLQHYAALGRDKIGAESVNLSPEPRPCDVYSDVAEMVEKIRQKDADEGLAIAQALDGFIKRKVIKQTVMTTVYGVTKYGAKYQILRQLRYLDEFDQDLVWQAAVYLTEKTFYCLREMFTATKEIQDTLILYAQSILKYRNQPIEWTTPLGLPVVQPYNKAMKNRTHTSVSKLSPDEHPNAVKQRSAFPPNYIHSLDSTHMMLTALYCLRAGITYVSVHDCYWTHPSTVNIMNRICREQFIALHSQPILEQLSRSLVERYAYRKSDDESELVDKQLFDILRKIPERGNFDLSKVMESTYFFS